MRNSHYRDYDRMISRKTEQIRETEGDEAAERYAAEEWAKVSGQQVGILGGAIAGGAIGSVVPVIGTAAGVIIGGIAGAFGGWKVGEKIARK